MNREQIIERVLEDKVIVIARGIKDEDLIPLAEAMYDGGIRLMEITYDAKGDPTDDKVASNIKRLSDHFGERMLIGAGTVITTAQVEKTRAAGGKFIISPNVDKDVIRATREAGLVSIPGALTPTEAMDAHHAGADFVKLFPVNAFGPSYVKAIKAPLSQLKLLAVGGVSPENMADYAAAGACGFGVGSTIIDKKLIAEGDFKGITELAKKYTK